DRVRAVVHRRKRSYAHARTLELLEPSAQRIPALAHHPGVPWQVLPYERQLAVKQDQVDEALRRIGRLDGFELQELAAATQLSRCRNKLELSFEGQGERLVCGFHASAGGRGVEPFDDCLLASERGNLARETVLRWCRGEGLSAWDRGAYPEARERRTSPAADGRVRLRNLVVRESRPSGQLQIRIVTTAGELDAGSLARALTEELGEALCGVLWTRSRSLAETTAGGETELVWGEGALPERIGELDLR